MCSIFTYSRYAFMLLLCSMIKVSESTAVSINRNRVQDLEMFKFDHPKLNPYYRLRRNDGGGNEKSCGPHDLEMVETIMHRICMLCHEIKSHYAPNTRVECSKDCYQNSTFHSCMRIFSGVPKSGRVEPTAPVPLYTEESNSLDNLSADRQPRTAEE